MRSFAVRLAVTAIAATSGFAAGPARIAPRPEDPTLLPNAGCTGRPFGAACDDANPCTTNDTCGIAGVCAGVAADPTPAEINDLRVTRSGVDAVLRWSAPGDAVGIDVVRGKLGQGKVSPLGVAQSCLGRGLDPFAEEATDYSNPPVGTGYWYLVRATNVCGYGVWGSQRVPGQPTDRIRECGCTPDPSATQATRYVDHVYTVTDRVTCLEWEKKVGGALHDPNATLNWYQSTGFVTTPPNWVGAVNAERFAGYGDWRLPASWGPPAVRANTSPELESLLLESCPGSPTPCIDAVFGPFPAGTTAVYWSATTINEAPYGPEYAWGVDHLRGGWDGGLKRYYADHVRAVRGGF